MDFLRRLTLLLYGLALLALVVVLLLFPDTVADALRSLGDVPSTTRGAIAVVVGFVIVVAIFLMVRSPRVEHKDGLIVKTPGALADVSISSARERILKAVLDVPNVVSADMRLQAPQGKADIDLAVEVAGTNINVPEKQKEIDRALRQITLKQLGLQLAHRPRVHIQLVTDEEVRARDEAAQQSALPPAPVAPVSEPWTPPPPPETRSVTPVAAVPYTAPVVPPPPPEPVGESLMPIEVVSNEPPVDDEPLAIEVSPTPVWNEPILPPEETSEAPTELTVSDEESEGALAEVTGWGEPVMPVAPEDEQPPLQDFDSLIESDADQPDWLKALTQGPVVIDDTPESEGVETDSDSESGVPPVDFVIAPSSEPADEAPAGEVDVDSPTSRESEADDWLRVDSSESWEAGLSDEDADRAWRGLNQQSPPESDRE